MEFYDALTAEYYRRYRPPIHAELLGRLLPLDVTFDVGLDFGCGIGHSAVALADICHTVEALDASQAMLNVALPAAGVNYVHYAGDTLPYPDGHFDVITLAGSWFFVRSEEFARELARVCAREGYIVLYDFVAPTSMLPMLLELDYPQPDDGYAPDTDLGAYAPPKSIGLLRTVEEEYVQSKMDFEQLISLCLSDRDVLRAVAAEIGDKPLYAATLERIRQRIPEKLDHVIVPIKTYGSCWQRL